MPQVSWPNRSTGFALQTTGSVCPSLGLSTAGPHNFQVFSPALLFKWNRKPQQVGGPVFSTPLPEWQGERPLQATLKFPGRLSLGEAESDSKPWLWLILLPVHNTGTFHPRSNFALGAISSAHPASHLKQCWHT